MPFCVNLPAMRSTENIKHEHSLVLMICHWRLARTKEPALEDDARPFIPDREPAQIGGGAGVARAQAREVEVLARAPVRFTLHWWHKQTQNQGTHCSPLLNVKLYRTGVQYK